MLTKIAAIGAVAALALGFASAASAKDYDDLLKDNGVVAYESGAPFPYSEYGQLRNAEVRAAMTPQRRGATRAPYAAARSNPVDVWPGQW